MKTAGIRELKVNLSSYLQRVQQGEVLFITDRGRIVAEVRPSGTSAPVADLEAHRHARLVQNGLVRPAPAPDERSWADWAGLGLPRGQAKAILDAERGE
jgi:antitoxin (DNA-binding transcriptional repressor) of toxin-antitoxin stability system